MKKKINENIGLIIVVVTFVLVGGYVSNYYLQNRIHNLSDDKVYKISDSTKDVILLNKMIMSQNKFGECINEIALLYKEKTGKDYPIGDAEKSKQCISKLNKKIIRTLDKNYLVNYTQELPEECKSGRTSSELLKVEIDAKTLESNPVWAGGITMSQITQKQKDDIDKSLTFTDCKSYAEYVYSGLIVYKK